jgi:hypothetical protein
VLPPRVTGDDPRRRPLRVALISNPTSGRNARRGLLAGIHDLLGVYPGVAHFEERTYGGIAAATRAAMRDDAGILAVNGGDGTVQAVLSSMLGAPSARLPVLAVLAGGTTNTTARNVGYGGRPLAALERVLAASASGVLAGTVERHPVLRADLDGGPHYAMMFGAGAVYHGIVFAREQLASRGMRGQLGAGLALATFLTRALSGRGGALFPPLAADVHVDGERLPPAPYFGVLASTMSRQFLDVRPYWGVGPGRVRCSALRARPRHLGRAIVPALRGRPSRWLHPDFGYRSVNAEEIALTFTGGFTLDGELFAPAAGERRIALTARQSAYFLRAPA